MKKINYNGNLSDDIRLINSKFSYRKVIVEQSSMITIGSILLTILFIPFLLISNTLSYGGIINIWQGAFKLLILMSPFAIYREKDGFNENKNAAKKRIEDLINNMSISEGINLSKESFSKCEVETIDVKKQDYHEKEATIYVLDNEQKLCALKEYKKELLESKEKIKSFGLLEDKDMSAEEKNKIQKRLIIK